jgi:hypothetical protein
MPIKLNFVFKLIIFYILISASFCASAQRGGRQFEGSRHRSASGHWHGGNIHRFEIHDRALWRAGHWRHARYSGRFGWWWVVGPSWYFYSQPIYPYPDPYIPSVVTIPQSSPVVQNWYYCEAAKEYYPYVSTCPGGWKTVPATPVK